MTCCVCVNKVLLERIPFLVNYFAYQVVNGGEGNFHVLLRVAGKNYTMYDFAKNSRNVKGTFRMG